VATYTPKELVAPTSLGASAGTSVYTQPASVVTILRTIHAQCPNSGHSFTLSLGADAAGTRLFDGYGLTAKVPAIFNGWWAIASGAGGAHAIDANADASSQVVLTIGGYEFS
jgi:hypothetical protein